MNVLIRTRPSPASTELGRGEDGPRGYAVERYFRTWGLHTVALAILALVLLGSGAVSPVQAAAGKPSDVVQEIGDNAVAALSDEAVTLEERTVHFRHLLHDYFDLNVIGRFALGRYWRIASDEQKSDYLKAFGEYVVRTYAELLNGYSGETFTVLSEQEAGKKDVIVRSRIDRPQGAPVLAEWRLRRDKGDYRVIDVSVEGISMAVTQRGEFQSVVQRHGIDGLIQTLEARTNKTSAIDAKEPVKN